MAFHGGVTGWVDEGRAVDVAHLDRSKASDTVSHNSPGGQLRPCGLDEGTVRQIESWLMAELRGCDQQRRAQLEACSWRVPQGSALGPALSNGLTSALGEGAEPSARLAVTQPWQERLVPQRLRCPSARPGQAGELGGGDRMQFSKGGAMGAWGASGGTWPAGGGR